MPARKKTSPPAKDEEMSFEDALTKIGTIVDSMESDQLPLENLVSQYEKGSQLLKHCDSVLASARKRIELITLANLENNGTDLSKEQNTPKGASSQNDEDLDDSNDISLS